MCKRGRLRMPGPSRSGPLSMPPRKLRFRAQILTAILTTTGYLSLYLPVCPGGPNLHKSALLSSCVPLCLPVSLKENDYEQRGSQVRVLPSVNKALL